MASQILLYRMFFPSSTNSRKCTHRFSFLQWYTSPSHSLLHFRQKSKLPSTTRNSTSKPKFAKRKKWKETWEWTSIIFSIIPHWTSRLNVSVWATKSLATCHSATAHTYDEQDLNKQTNKTTQHPNICILTQVIAKQPHKLNHYSLNILLWHSFSQFLSVYFGQKQITASKESKHFWV